MSAQGGLDQHLDYQARTTRNRRCAAMVLALLAMPALARGQLPPGPLESRPRSDEVETAQVGGAGVGRYYAIGELRCQGTREAIVGVKINAGSAVDFLQIACAPVQCSGDRCSWEDEHWGASAGTQGGGAPRSPQLCRYDEIVSGFRARTRDLRIGGLLFDYLADFEVQCAKITGAASATKIPAVFRVGAVGGSSPGSTTGGGERRTTGRTDCGNYGATAISVAVGLYPTSGSHVVQALSFFCPRPVKEPEPAAARVFHYYYINGINTPQSLITPLGTKQQRGTYDWEYGLVANNLVAKTKQSDPAAQGEDNRMEMQTHNVSGADPGTEPLFNWYCLTHALDKNLDWSRCNPVMQLINCIRGDMNLLSGTPGDFLESFRQSMPRSVFGGGTALAKNDPLVLKVARDILRIYQEAERTGGRTKHYFIVVAHSQGNFFAEGLAEWFSTVNPTVAKRVGILGLASPTDYSDVIGKGIQIVTATRGDDIILLLDEVNLVGIRIGKRPARPNLPPFDPWNYTNAKADLQQGWNRVTGAVSGILGCWVRWPQNSDNDAAFDMPRVNSHIIDSYLRDPLPKPGVNPVQSQVLKMLAQLKQVLRSQ